MPIEFGALVPCRVCHGTGRVRAPADPQAARERARERRRGKVVDKPPAMGPCWRCHGAMVLPPAEADAPIDTPPRPGSRSPAQSRALVDD